MEKDFLIKQKEKLEKEKKHLEDLLSSFSKRDKNLPENWRTIFPQFGKHTSEHDENVDEVEEYSNLLPIEYRLELKLLDVERALRKIEKGNYGICEKCGKEIKKERLEVLPEAKFCSLCAKK